MPSLIIFFALAIMILMYFNVKKNNKSIDNKPKNELQIPDDTIRTVFSKEQILKLLEKLASEELPAQLNPGAMCYAPRRIPNSIDYICPKCGEKSIYSGSEVYMISGDLQKCRSLIKLLPSEQFKLDESSLCKKCKPHAEKVELCLLVTYGNGNDLRNCPITSDDLKLINEFLSGKLIHKTSNDSELALKNYTERIKILLGIDK